jgi:hypothetical protein
MENSPAWKLSLLNETLPKFIAAINACEKEEPSEIKAPALSLIKAIQSAIFPGETQLHILDPQEKNDPDPNRSQLKVVI